jgi:hypothetical protein
MLLQNFSSVITMAIFTCTCGFRFSIVVSVGSQKCSVVWCTLKHGVAHNPVLHYWRLYFVLVSLFWQNTHTTEFSYTAWANVCCDLSQVFLVGSRMRLVFFVLWSEVRHSSHLLGIRSLFHVSLDCQSENFEPQEAKMIKLLRMVRSRISRNSFFVHIQVCLLIE